MPCRTPLRSQALVQHATRNMPHTVAQQPGAGGSRRCSARPARMQRLATALYKRSARRSAHATYNLRDAQADYSILHGMHVGRISLATREHSSARNRAKEREMLPFEFHTATMRYTARSPARSSSSPALYRMRSSMPHCRCVSGCHLFRWYDCRTLLGAGNGSLEQLPLRLNACSRSVSAHAATRGGVTAREARR